MAKHPFIVPKSRKNDTLSIARRPAATGTANSAIWQSPTTAGLAEQLFEEYPDRTSVSPVRVQESCWRKKDERGVSSRIGRLATAVSEG